MSWAGHQQYPPPPQGYYPPPNQHPQQYPPQPPGPYGTHSPYPPSAPPAPPGGSPQNMNQAYYGHPPPHGGHSPYPPQAHGSPYPPAAAPYGGGPGYPPQSQSPYPPQQHGHSPYPPQQAPYPPPQGPPGQYGAPPQHSSSNRDAEALRRAMQGLGTNEKELIRILSSVPSPGYMAQVEAAYHGMYHRKLLEDVHSETSGYFRDSLEAIIRGPLKQDVYTLNDAIIGTGTNEPIIDDVLLGRSNADMGALKRAYWDQYHRHLEKDVHDDLSLKTQQLFDMVIREPRTEEYEMIYPQMLEDDVRRLHDSTVGRMGKDAVVVCQIFSKRSDGQLRAVAHEFQRKYQRPLRSVISKEFSGHMRDALLRMLSMAEDKAKADADRLEEAMAGFGTKDWQLVTRLVRIHWDKQHLHQVKAAYRHYYGKDLSTRVAGETSRHYRDLMVALCGQ